MVCFALRFQRVGPLGFVRSCGRVNPRRSSEAAFISLYIYLYVFIYCFMPSCGMPESDRGLAAIAAPIGLRG